MKTKNQIVCGKGEDVACTFLMKHGFSILERNYLKKWGRVHVVAEKDQRIHFVEVRSSSRKLRVPVIHETVESYPPEGNICQGKLKKMRKLAVSYLEERSIPPEKRWTCAVIDVLLDMRQRIARVSYIKDTV